MHLYVYLGSRIRVAASGVWCAVVPSASQAVPPVVYVAPTSTMEIRPSEIVDTNGLVAANHLFSWGVDLGRSGHVATTLAMLEAVVLEFGQRCPVVAKMASPPGSHFFEPSSSQAGVGDQARREVQINPQVAHLDVLFRDSVEKLAIATVASTQPLRKARAKLESNAGRLEALVVGAAAERSTAVMVANAYDTIGGKYEDAQRGCIGDGAIDIDFVIRASSPLHSQIVALVAEDSAIEDTLYLLGNAMQGDVLDIGSCLKALRAMSRRQFSVRRLLARACAVGRL
jgi:hypothetical protein